jgi:hypothetical protein
MHIKKRIKLFLSFSLLTTNSFFYDLPLYIGARLAFGLLSASSGSASSGSACDALLA